MQKTPVTGDRKGSGGGVVFLDDGIPLTRLNQSSNSTLTPKMNDKLFLGENGEHCHRYLGKGASGAENSSESDIDEENDVDGGLSGGIADDGDLLSSRPKKKKSVKEQLADEQRERELRLLRERQAAESKSRSAATSAPAPVEKKDDSGARKHRTPPQLEGWDVEPYYEVIKYLGKGSYAQVASAKNVITGEVVAIKRVHRVFNNVSDAKRLLREITILRLLKHPNIIDIRDILPPKDKENFMEIYIVFELVDTDLAKIICSDQFFSLDHVKYILYQQMCSLYHLHSAHVLHRDMKPENILLTEGCDVKICDFGLARGVDMLEDNNPLIKDRSETGESSKSNLNLSRQLTRHVVTRWYRAPELILLSKKYNRPIDVWSLGCIFAELLGMMQSNVSYYKQRRALFPGSSCFPMSPDHPTCYNDRCDQLNVIFDVIGTPTNAEIEAVDDQMARQYLRNLPTKVPTDLRTIFPGAPADALSLLSSMLTFDPNKRISLETALKHPFVAEFRDLDLEKPSAVVVDMPWEQETLSKQDLRGMIYDEILRHHEIAKSRASKIKK